MRVKTHPPAAPGTERKAQKRRTRKAIVDATATLLARGHTPTVNDVAAAADVSRRTIYLHFPSFDQLLLDATVGALSQTQVDRAIEVASSGGDDAQARVEGMVRALHHVGPEVERLGRALVRLTVENGAGAEGEPAPRRGYRRIEWIETALSPWRGRLEPAAWDRLVNALAMVIGWEAMIVQRDVCGLDRRDGEELSIWVVRALLGATLRETSDSEGAAVTGGR
jgi:AcrR family transcriptional regulator